MSGPACLNSPLHQQVDQSVGAVSEPGVGEHVDQAVLVRLRDPLKAAHIEVQHLLGLPDVRLRHVGLEGDHEEVLGARDIVIVSVLLPVTRQQDISIINNQYKI